MLSSPGWRWSEARRPGHQHQKDRQGPPRSEHDERERELSVDDGKHRFEDGEASVGTGVHQRWQQQIPVCPIVH